MLRDDVTTSGRGHTIDHEADRGAGRGGASTGVHTMFEQKQNRDRYHTVRMTEAEEAAVKAAAETAGLSIADFVREAIRAAVERGTAEKPKGRKVEKSKSRAATRPRRRTKR